MPPGGTGPMGPRRNYACSYVRRPLRFCPTGEECLTKTVHMRHDRMNDVKFQIRVPAADLEGWRKQSMEEGRTVSAWIRGRCNGGQVQGASSDMEVRATEWAPAFRSDHRRGSGGSVCKHGARPELCRRQECRTAS